ncbi:MAG: nucleotide sugar dehydrogenase [Deltaproteobacteria bacterium]|nr:MAG: nucleotide sugar dehydrogenase [Deltaproteobacteria bacterium]
MRISVFGLGYVGCVTAACLAKDGHRVLGVDVTPSKVVRFGRGLPTVVEPRLDALLRRGYRARRLSATADARAAVLATDVSIICVGTPSRRDGSLDLSAVRETAETIGRALTAKTSRHLVILRSTVPPGTAESIILPALGIDGAPTERRIGFVVVPEFLREGTAIADYYHPSFVLVGSADGQPDGNARTVAELFNSTRGPLTWVPYREAEMLKSVCNVFHALKVAFANEIGTLCAALSIDGHALMERFVTDRKLNLSAAYLRPGLPFGGSCLPKDLRMVLHLSNRENCDLPVLRAVMGSNESHLLRTVERITDCGGRRVALDGLAFKSGTDDLRESPLVRIAEHLLGKGYDLKIYDPAVEASRLTGANRQYIEERVPHLSSRLVTTLDELLDRIDVLVVARHRAELLERVARLGRPLRVVDLAGPVPGVEIVVDAVSKPRYPHAVAASAPAPVNLEGA